MPGQQAPPGGWAFYTESAFCCEACGRPLVKERDGVKLEGAIVTVGDKTVKLTIRERDVFAVLFRHFGETVHREVLRRSVWGPDHDDDKSLDVFVCRLRPKLAPLGLTIKNTWGVGKMLDFADPPVVNVQQTIQEGQHAV